MNKTIIKMRSTCMNLRIDEYNLWVKDVIRWQNSNFDINIILMDLCYLLQSEKIEQTKECSYEITNDLFSLGINNNKVNIVRQSNFPEIQELTAYLQYFYKVTSPPTGVGGFIPLQGLSVTDRCLLLSDTLHIR